MDMSKEWKRGDCQKKLWSGVYQEEENEVDQNLPGWNGLEDWWEKTGLMEEDWNDRSKLEEEDYIIVKWAQEDVETLYSLINK